MDYSHGYYHTRLICFIYIDSMCNFFSNTVCFSTVDFLFIVQKTVTNSPTTFKNCKEGYKLRKLQDAHQLESLNTFCKL